jgi:uncharacterized repeat protein (TIGR03803 family)
MSTARILSLLNAKLNDSRHLALACALLMAITAVPLRSQTYQDLYDFNCSTGGCNPFDSGQLTQGADGNLYGTTTDDNTTSGFGTIFMVTPSGTHTQLVQFNGTNGGDPIAGLTLASDGNFYGTTAAGGSGYGTVFRFTPPATLTVLHVFNFTDGYSPEGAPVEAKDGNLYGATYPGTTYRITLPAGTYKQLPNNTPGFTFDPLLLASDGNLYGTTFNGGPGGSGPGTVFRMTTAGAIKVIHNFTDTGNDGAFPDSPLTQAADGNLYGTTHDGGANNSGEVFKLTLAGNFTTLHSFDAYTGTFDLNNDGGGPVAGLLVASDGNLYGANSLGGAFGNGTLFRITTGGSFTKLFDFGTGIDSGPQPLATLVEHTNGIYYGVTDGSATSGSGNFYSLIPTNPIQILRVAGPVWVKPGDPVEILGNNLNEVSRITFAGVQAQFKTGSDTYLVAQVPRSAVDGRITATLVTSQKIKTQVAVHILPVITNLDPSSGPVGSKVSIVGGGFAGANKVSFGGIKATRFTVVTPSKIQATVPTGARTGKVTVITPNGSATSKQKFTVE